MKSSIDSEENFDDDRSDNNYFKVGQGHFGKKMEVRQGMGEEAKRLRKEWTGKNKKGKKQKERKL